MSQAQIDATVLLCRLLDREPPETAGLDFFTGANEAAGAQLLRERLLVMGPLLEWVTCPECRVELARVVRDESPATTVLLCPECWEVTAPRRVRETYKVALSRLVASLLNGLGLSPSGLQPLEPDVSWRLGTTEARRGQPVTWYFARRLRQPEIAARLRGRLASAQTTQSAVILTSSEVPLPAGSPLTEFDVRPLLTLGRIGQSRFEFFAQRQAAPGPQVLAEATPGTSLRYVRTAAAAFVDGVRYALEPRQQAILVALLDHPDHELGKAELKAACGSQSLSFSPSKEFQRNATVYAAFIRYLRDDERYALCLPEEDSAWLP